MDGSSLEIAMCLSAFLSYYKDVSKPQRNFIIRK
jgi:hypothetical protein